jgi:hypothetical protein
MDIEEHLQIFRQDLLTISTEEIVQKHITSGECFTMPNYSYFELKKRVSSFFHLHINEIVVVGSAKLGFSIVPFKRYRHFGDHSDIDVVICSISLFDQFWIDVFNFWLRGEIWDEIDQFRKYLFRGWIRPDKLPPSKSFSKSLDWWEFFRSLSATGDFGPYKISGAIYKTWHFLESYQAQCVIECQRAETFL